jgi:hypothetical protein
MEQGNAVCEIAAVQQCCLTLVLLLLLLPPQVLHGCLRVQRQLLQLRAGRAGLCHAADGWQHQHLPFK